MKLSSLSVFIIETPNSNRSAPLKKSLLGDSRIEINTIKASMISSQSELDKSAISIEGDYFWAVSNRYLTLPEIGCANSHNLARLACSNLEIGGVILEDDARILDRDRFVNSSLLFLNRFKETSSILSLTYDTGIRDARDPGDWSQSIRLIGDAPLAVAYAITPLAARRLFDANSPVKYVSDWPAAKVKNYSLIKPPVSHGDSATISTIDPAGVLGRSRRNLKFTFSKITLLDYFFRARRSVKLSTYLNFNLLKPLRFHIDSFRFLILGYFWGK